MYFNKTDLDYCKCIDSFVWDISTIESFYSWIDSILDANPNWYPQWSTPSDWPIVFTFSRICTGNTLCATIKLKRYDFYNNHMCFMAHINKLQHLNLSIDSAERMPFTLYNFTVPVTPNYPIPITYKLDAFIKKNSWFKRMFDKLALSIIDQIKFMCELCNHSHAHKFKIIPNTEPILDHENWFSITSRCDSFECVFTLKFIKQKRRKIFSWYW